MSNTILKSQKHWMPESIVLENVALDVVKSDYNTIVIAGPGAGKTELLAQRACYLLQTNTCPYPKRILAVSFKKDSAANLSERVSKRCGADLSRRLDSYTFDKFCKELLDRFILTVPLSFRPVKDYLVDTNNDLLYKAYDLAGYPRQRFSPQDSKPNYPKPVVDIMIKGMPEKDFQPTLNFNMISRLALYILQNNPYILASLQKTYSHVFLDEFQDTTTLQYEVVSKCFQVSSSIITAVGDQKQRIMLWAGAMPNAFDKFIVDFSAKIKTMVMNHRSAPQLLLLQKSLYKSLNEKEIDIISPNDKWKPDDGYALLSVFPNEDSERQFIREKLLELINTGTKPRDICILVKRSIDEYLGNILEYNVTADVKIRNEVIYQDLLKEDAVKFIVAVIYSAISTGKPNAYMYVQDIDLQIKGIDIDDANKVNAQYLVLNSFLDTLATDIKNITVEDTEASLNSIVDKTFGYIGEQAYCDANPQYTNGDFFQQTKTNLIARLWSEFCATQDWVNALNNFEGENSIPAMTIHKSKGLEYDTVFVVGIENSAFFADRSLSQEDVSAFFVAVSRAKQHLFITTSKERSSVQRGGGQQLYSNVKVLYDALQSSGKIQINNYAISE